MILPDEEKTEEKTMKNFLSNVKGKLLLTGVAVSNAIMMAPVLSAQAAETNVAQELANPIIKLIKQFAGPLLGVVGAVGAIFVIVLGVKFAKAEEPQEREKAKAHLKNAIIGFALIFILLLALNIAMPKLIDWVNAYGTNTTGNITKVS